LAKPLPVAVSTYILIWAFANKNPCYFPESVCGGGFCRVKPVFVSEN
jgi:hypothetical protein